LLVHRLSGRTGENRAVSREKPPLLSPRLKLILAPIPGRTALRHLFLVIHQREQLPQAVFAGRLEAARVEVMRQATEGVPPTKAAANLAARLEKYGGCYFRFITTPGVEPTNNLAEQAIRFVVIDRHITQGTRGEVGQRWSERIWTVIATCAQQGRSVWKYLEGAVRAYLNEVEAPALLPSGKP
jgi:transposase